MEDEDKKEPTFRDDMMRHVDLSAEQQAIGALAVAIDRAIARESQKICDAIRESRGMLPGEETKEGGPRKRGRPRGS